MLKSIALFAAVIMSATGAFAQTTPAGPSSEVLQSCLLGTNTSTWTELKLTSDQLERARRIQEACKEECAVAGAKKSKISISNADGSTIIGELKNVLSTEQYRDWVAYCSGHSSK